MRKGVFGAFLFSEVGRENAFSRLPEAALPGPAARLEAEEPVQRGHGAYRENIGEEQEGGHQHALYRMTSEEKRAAVGLVW